MRPSITSPERRPWHAAWLPLLAWLLLVILPGFAQAAPRFMRATVTYVVDGDSVWVKPDRGGAPRPVRLRGIDAPEICQPYGRAARDALASRVLDRPVTLRLHGRDAYQRLLGELATPSGDDVGAWMVSQGHAWSPRYRGRDGAYARQQDRARDQRRGLWAEGRAIEPRTFRRRHGSCH